MIESRFYVVSNKFTFKVAAQTTQSSPSLK